MMWELIGIFIIVGLLWRTPVVYPLKLLVVFFHELSHALAALATGGDVVNIQLTWDEGGVTNTIGGNAFIITSAGYLGSLLWGALILILLSYVRDERWLTQLLGLMLFIVTIVYVRNSFGFGFGLAMGGAMILAAGRMSLEVNDFLLKFFGLTSCLYVVLDIYSDTIARSSLPSDARLLAEMTGIPTVLTGSIWIIIAIVWTGWALQTAMKGSR